MIFLYHGDDTFESLNAAKEKLSDLAIKANAEAKVVNADEISSVEEFLQNLEGLTMFSSGFSLLAKRFFNNKKLVDLLTNDLKKLSAYDWVIWHDGKVDSRLKIIKDLKKSHKVLEFNLPKSWEFEKWVSSEASKLSLKLSGDIVKYLVEKIGLDKSSILNELTKLSLYQKASGKSSLTKDDVKKTLGFEIKGDIWEFLDAVGARDKQKAITEFQKLTTYENQTQYLLVMLGREFNNIGLVLNAINEGIDTKTLGFHPFVLDKTLKKSKQFTFTEIQNFLRKLVNVDKVIKLGQIDENVALVMFLNEL